MTSYNERGGRRAWTSKLTINYFKRNVTTISRCYGTVCAYYKMLRNDRMMTTIQEGRQDRTSHDDKMQCNNATIKQSGRDEMRQGAGYNNEARQDATTQRRNNTTTQRLDNNEMRGMTRDVTQRKDVAWQHDRTGSNDKGQRDNATTNQTNKRTDKQTNKAHVM